MTEKITQPTSKPTRKIGAVIAATFIVQGTLGVLDHFMPGIADNIPAADWVALLVPLFAGWWVRDKA